MLISQEEEPTGFIIMKGSELALPHETFIWLLAQEV